MELYVKKDFAALKFSVQGLVRKESVKILVVIGFSDSVLVSLPVGSLYLRGEIFSPGRRKSILF